MTTPDEPASSRATANSDGSRSGRSAADPGWVYALAGWLLAATQLDGGPRAPTDDDLRQRVPFGALGELDGDPDTMTLRGLRRLTAIGPARALAIARARWVDGLSGGPEAWDAIRGIGPETVAAIRRHLDASSAANATAAPVPGGRGSSLRGVPGSPSRAPAGDRMRGAQPAADSKPGF
jgi:hypothetical protein